MTGTLSERLNQIIPRVTSKEFLSSEGIGNEIACYIFDYPAAEELTLREHIRWMMGRFSSHHRELDVLHLNLFDVVVDYLRQRRLFEKTLKMQAEKGDMAVLKALKGVLAAEKVRDFIAAAHDLQAHDLVLISGVGSAWPMMRAHGLLNCLHTVLGQTPLVLFYPGRFDHTTLKLFGRYASDKPTPGAKSYYRAFSLVPSEKMP